MASAAASRPPAPPAQALQWLGPRVSFSMDEAGGGREAPGGASSSADFEFFLGGCSAPSMLPADELFSGGKLVPLRTAAAEAEEAPKQQPAPARADGEAEKGVAAGGDEPKVPARRWRDLLRLRKQQGPADPLRRLLLRGPKPPGPEPTLSLPLLRESDEKTSSPAATASAPPPTPPPPSQQNQLPPKIRLSPSQQQAVTSSPPPPPPPPAAVAADSPRLNAAGKVVFNGLGRSSSSPSSLAGGRRGHRGGIERSYSAHVRVAPVLNVCSLRGSRKSVSVFGIDRLFASPSSAANAAAAAKKARAKATPQ